MAKFIFITGTDTGVGKTRVACALIHAARSRGIRVAGFKPIAAGCEQVDGEWVNEDALALQQASSSPLPYAAVNPIALPEPIAPHLAAARAATVIDLKRLDAAADLLAKTNELVVVEGAGGWAVPVDDALTVGDWIARRGWPVVLVVGMRLGCLNHALLSAESIRRRNPLVGWVANVLPPAMPELAANIESLSQRLPEPLLGWVGEGVSAEQAAATLDLAAALKPRAER